MKSYFFLIIEISFLCGLTVMSYRTVSEGQDSLIGDAVAMMKERPQGPDAGQVRFVDNGNGIVTDTITGLLWLRDEGGEMNWNAAVDYCNSLSLGGYRDWRLPDVEELETIVDKNKSNPSIDTLYFPHAHSWRYWTSYTDGLDERYAWFIYFSHYMVDNLGKSSGTGYVRCVRGSYDSNGEAAHNGRFIDHEDGTVTDTYTGLVWQQDEGGKMDWMSAMKYCERLSLRGYTDWRLPGINELKSVVDDGKQNPAIDTVYFPDARPSAYWSSSSYPLDDRYAWIVFFSHVFLENHHKSNSYRVRCVRELRNNNRKE
jgi:hypothetical protein